MTLTKIQKILFNKIKKKHEEYNYLLSWVEMEYLDKDNYNKFLKLAELTKQLKYLYKRADFYDMRNYINLKLNKHN